MALGRLHGGRRRALRGGAPACREEPPRRPRARGRRGPRRSPTASAPKPRRAQAAVRAAASAESAALEAARGARRAFDLARERLTAAERREADAAAKRSALHEAADRLGGERGRGPRSAGRRPRWLADLGHAPALEARLLELARGGRRAPRRASEARAALQTLIREAEMRGPPPRRDRCRDAAVERARRARRRRRRGIRRARLARLQGERKSLAEMPDAFILRRRALMAEVEDAEAGAATPPTASPRPRPGSPRPTAPPATRSRRLSAAREARAGSQARLEAATRRLAEITRSIADNLETTPAGLAELAGLKADAPLPDLDAGRDAARQPQGRARAPRRRQPARRGGARRDRAPSATTLVARARRPRRGDQAPAPGDRQPQPRGPRAPARRLRRRQRPFPARCSRTCSAAARAELQLIEFRRPARGRPRDPRPPAGQEAADA